MSIQKRASSPYYYADFTVKGERVFRSTGTASRREAEAIERQWKAEKRKEIAERTQASGLTLDKGFAAYWKERKQKWRPTWASEVARYIKDIITKIDKDTMIEAVTDETVNQYVTACRAAGVGGYAINRALSVWSGMHTRARKVWKIKTHEIDWQDFKSPETKRIRFLTIEEVQRLIAVLPEHVALAVEWSLYTGCRKTETFGLAWETVYFDRGYATVIAKGGREHTVWLTPFVIGVLERCDTSRRFVFDRTNARKHWQAALKKLKLENFRWHDLRHCHATWLRQSGASVEVVQRSLGHRDLATTMRYAHVADAELQEALHKLPQLSTSKTHVSTKITSIFQAKQQVAKGIK